MQKFNVVDVEVRTCRSPDLRHKIATAVAFAQLFHVRTFLKEELIHGCQTKVSHGVRPSPRVAIDMVVE